MKYVLLISVAIAIASCSNFGPNLGNLVDKKKSDSYFINSDGQISFCQSGNWFELGSVKVDADARSFKVLSTEIAEDKNFVFYRSSPQKQIDRKTFSIANKIPKDSLNVYAMIDSQVGFSTIVGADPKTYEYLENNSWSRDKNSYFFNYKKIPVDRKTFRLINQSFSADKDSIYMATYTGDFKSILPNTGGAKAINKQYMQIRRNIYYISYHPDPTILVNSFNSIDKIRILDKDIICVNNNVISYGKEFNYPNVDANSLELFPGKRQEAVEDRYLKDKNNVYYNGELINGAKVNSYVPMSFGFGKDAKNAYYETRLLKGVDSKSFKPTDSQDTGIFMFRDKLGNKFDYYTGKKLN